MAVSRSAIPDRSAAVRSRQSTRRLAVATALACLALAVTGSWWREAQPVSLADGVTARLPCVSYAPSKQSGDSRSGVTVEQLRKDLALLAKRTRCVRTYTVAEGFDQVPAVAHELGLEVLLGLWISRDAVHNDREIELAVRTARQHRATIRALVVGNEVLLRREQTAADLSALVRRVSASTGMPVTYADVWGYWLKHRSLAQSVSFVTVHILPYWDDVPVGVDEVIPYVDALYGNLEAAFPGKHLFIGETGWPSAGRPRGPIEPGRVNQARYLREFTVLAEKRGFDFSVIEAFDQPWKISHEGTVGGHWGLYDGERREKFPWTGPVVESAHGGTVALVALLTGALGALIGAFLGGPGRIPRALTTGGAAALAVAVLMRQRDYLVAGNVNWIDWAATLTICVAGWLAFVMAIRSVVRTRIAPEPIARPLGLLILLGCAYVCLGLVFAGRHRDFPVWLFLPGVLAFVVSAAIDPRVCAAALRVRRANEEIVLAAWLIAAGILIPLLERLQNPRAWGWGLASLLLGAAVLLPLALQARERHRTAEHPHARPGERVQHHPPAAERES
jgi:glucan 1,3-beta-glucosidase